MNILLMHGFGKKRAQMVKKKFLIDIDEFVNSLSSIDIEMILGADEEKKIKVKAKLSMFTNQELKYCYRHFTGKTIDE